eukprot:gene9882-biopygen688
MLRGGGAETGMLRGGGYGDACRVCCSE